MSTRICKGRCIFCGRTRYAGGPHSLIYVLPRQVGTILVCGGRCQDAFGAAVAAALRDMRAIHWTPPAERRTE
jgi:hypothetical protein